MPYHTYLSKIKLFHGTSSPVLENKFLTHWKFYNMQTGQSYFLWHCKLYSPIPFPFLKLSMFFIRLNNILQNILDFIVSCLIQIFIEIQFHQFNFFSIVVLLNNSYLLVRNIEGKKASKSIRSTSIFKVLCIRKIWFCKNITVNHRGSSSC